jgi:hypothetical protein
MSRPVSQDWRSPLSSEKAVTYHHTLRLLESTYAMFRVNLDEAIDLRRSGCLDKAYMTLRVTPTLCSRLASHVSVLLGVMFTHAKHFHTTPSISPLPGNFQHARGRFQRLM